jgi:hypothetical protein
VITRGLQWLATLVVAAAGFVLGVNGAGAKVYRTDVGRVRIDIRLDLPGNVVRVDVPQEHYAARLHPFRAPIEWRARTVSLNRRGRAVARQRGPLALARGVLDGGNAVLRSAARSFAWGVAGAIAGALVVAACFTVVLGRPLTRLLVALFAIAPLLAAGGVAFLLAGRGVT